MGMRSKGFTLLEVILVLGILVIILPLGFSIFLATSRAQLKVYVLHNVKRNGDTALSIMQNLIKTRALSLQQSDGSAICSSAPSSYSSGDVYFVDADDNRFRFYISYNKIPSEISSIGVSFLTNEQVSVPSGGFSLTCNRATPFSPPLVALSFSISQAASTSRAEEQAALNYQTKIRLRAY